MTAPQPGSGPVETKVTAASVVALVASVVIAVLNGVVGDSALLGALPAPLQAAILVVVPPLVTFLAAYAAPHTSRPDA